MKIGDELGRLQTAFTGALVPWFRAGARELPWRTAKTPYRVWLSEVMLQQTQVGAVVPYFERFVARFPTLEALAAAPADDVLSLWSGLGYYARARKLHEAAKLAAARGGLPRTSAELLALPGFGPYTSAAVASFAFGEDVALVDGNVARVLARLRATPGDVDAARAEAWRVAPLLVVLGAQPAINEALMELGATVCTRRAPACPLCPLAKVCAARRAGTADSLPAPRPAKAKRRLFIACVVSERRGEVLLARRAEGGLFGGLWEPPGVELASEAERARPLLPLRRALAGLGLRLGRSSARHAVARTLTHRALELDVHVAPLAGTPRAGPGYTDARWVPLGELGALGIASAASAALAACGVISPGRAARRVC